MRPKKIIAILMLMVFVLSMTTPVYATNDKSDTTIVEAIYSKFEPVNSDIYLRLQTGFDFLATSSSEYNHDLAVTGVALSQQVYDGKAEALLKKLGYDETKIYPEDGESSAQHPLSCMGYKHYTDDSGNEINVFAIVVRGTQSDVDKWTDITNGSAGYFDNSAANVKNDFKKFVEEVTGKSYDDLASEDNRFFITGHSLGGAVANKLSVEPDIKETLAGDDKGKIYTYTYEAPHTCAHYLWYDPQGTSYAFNFKDVDDAIASLPPYWGSTRYGTDFEFSTDMTDDTKGLDNSVFTSVFPNAKGEDVDEAPKKENYGDIFGHHDMGLDLVYIIQKGINDDYWDSVEDVILDEAEAAQIETESGTDSSAEGNTSETEVGGTITFGKYEQDNNTENGWESIEWTVLAIEEDKALVLSKYCLDCQPYNDVNESVTWENCTLRSWLNNDFLNSAFTSEEQEKIITTTLSNNADETSYYKTYGGNDTVDQMFLLSYKEYRDYCENAGLKLTTITPYCEVNGGWYGVNGKTNWWLRSPGRTNYTASVIGYYGISEHRVLDSGQRASVRPAMWVDSAAVESVGMTEETTYTADE